MRAALLIVLGLAIGIVGTVFAMNALKQRNPFPHAVMAVMAHHTGELRNAVKAQRCDAASNVQHLERLLSTSTDIAQAFPGVDQGFTDEATQLHTRLQAALQAAPADCVSLAAALKPVGETCQSCHQKYR
jgi:cytochrome c556